MYRQISVLAEVKERIKAGIPDRATRLEGLEGSRSEATHSDTSGTDMNHHEAAPDRMLYYKYNMYLKIYAEQRV